MMKCRDQRDDGASSVEYALVVFAIAAVIVIVVATLGTSTRGLFERTHSCFAAGASSTC